MLTLSARLQLELRNRDPSEVTELILDNSKANEIEGLDNSYSNLLELSLVNVGLTSLANFPCLSNLEKLDLSDNKISSGLEVLSGCENLKQLLLTNNRIKNIDDIKFLSSLKHLEVLDLFNCSISFMENYRREIFSIIPSLKYLDGFDEKNEELNESDEEYEDEDENVQNKNHKVIYDHSDNSGSEEDDDEEEEEEYESDEEAEKEEEDEEIEEEFPRVTSKTGGKDMGLYNHDDNASDDDEDDDDDDDEDDTEDLDNEDDDIGMLEDPVIAEMESSNQSIVTKEIKEVVPNLDENAGNNELSDGMNGIVSATTNSKSHVKEIDHYLSDSDDDDDEVDDVDTNEIDNDISNNVLFNRNYGLKRKFESSSQDCLLNNDSCAEMLDQDSRDYVSILINDAQAGICHDNCDDDDIDLGMPPKDKMLRHNFSSDSIERLLDDNALLDPSV